MGVGGSAQGRLCCPHCVVGTDYNLYNCKFFWLSHLKCVYALPFELCCYDVCLRSCVGMEVGTVPLLFCLSRLPSAF